MINIEKILVTEMGGRVHGREGDFLGLGLMYYTLSYIMKSNVSVCLGSGNGLIPALMRQAQLDLNLEQSKTILVDGNMPEKGWGRPSFVKEDGSIDSQHYFIKNWDCEIILKSTKEAAKHFREGEIDYLHIDADHSYQGAKADFYRYIKFMKRNFVITLHDSTIEYSVAKLVDELRDNSKYEVIEFSNPETRQQWKKHIKQEAKDRSNLQMDDFSEVPRQTWERFGNGTALIRPKW